MKDNNNNGWVEIKSYRKTRAEKEEKERLKYWSYFWNGRNKVMASCEGF